MKLSLANLRQNFKFQLFIGFAVLLIIYRFFFAPANTFPYDLINELIVLSTAFFFFLYLRDFTKAKKVNALSLVMNIGILNAVIFFISTFSGSIIGGLFGSISDSISNPGFFYLLVSDIYSFLILASVVYIFLAFRELYFLRQKKNDATYFNTLVVFIILASITNLLGEDLSYIKQTFLIISLLLIVINSLKISWIAFIIKKEKILLLILSVVIVTLFAVNVANNDQGTTNYQVISDFSAALTRFFDLIMIYGIVYFSVLFFTTLFHIPTAEAYDRKAQEVSSLQYFSRLITQVIDFNDLTETVTEIALKVVNASASWIAWKDNGEFKSIANNHIGFVDSEKLNEFLIENEKNENIKSTKILNLEKHKTRFNLSDNFTSIAVSPLKTHSSLRGYLVTAKKDNFIFDEEDKNALDTFSDYASVSIENSRLLEESIEKERLEKELDVAREIQQKIIPVKNPEIKNLSISSVFIPAFEVGGDYYDFLQIDENKLGFVIADVSGKGISAAFIMAEVKGIFESLSRIISSPKEILIKANEILRKTLERKTFVSAAFGVIDTDKQKLYLSRAGHCPIILLRDNNAIDLKPTGIGLGLDSGERFNDNLEEIALDLKDNDTVVLYTDGITEAKNKDQEDFGDKKFEKILLENINKSADEISNTVIKEITLHSQDTSQHDDITLVILKWKLNEHYNGVEEWQNSTQRLKTRE